MGIGQALAVGMNAKSLWNKKCGHVQDIKWQENIMATFVVSVVIIVPADGLVPFGAKTAVGTLMTKFRFCVSYDCNHVNTYDSRYNRKQNSAHLMGFTVPDTRRSSIT